MIGHMSVTTSYMHISYIIYIYIVLIIFNYTYLNWEYHRKLSLFMHQTRFKSRILEMECHLGNRVITGDPLHSRAACTQPCNVNTNSRAHCSPGARLCEQWGHGCVNNGARLCASARLCRGSPVVMLNHQFVLFQNYMWNIVLVKQHIHVHA